MALWLFRCLRGLRLMKWGVAFPKPWQPWFTGWFWDPMRKRLGTSCSICGSWRFVVIAYDIYTNINDTKYHIIIFLIHIWDILGLFVLISCDLSKCIAVSAYSLVIFPPHLICWRETDGPHAPSCWELLPHKLLTLEPAHMFIISMHSIAAPIPGLWYQCCPRLSGSCNSTCACFDFHLNVLRFIRKTNRLHKFMLITACACNLFVCNSIVKNTHRADHGKKVIAKEPQGSRLLIWRQQWGDHWVSVQKRKWVSKFASAGVEARLVM